MRKIIILLVCAAIVLAATAEILRNGASSDRGTTKIHPATDAINDVTISSPTFAKNSPIPLQFTCDGEDINPELHFEGVPGRAKSLALIMEDPDAPGGTFTHWLVWNIDPATTMLGEGARIEGATQGINSAGKTGYIGPCPPSGIHHYHFKLYALDAMLDLSPRAGKGRLEEEIGKHLITFAEIVGVYQRK
jgi:hypothetical protein